jgi:hypothetical protein
LNRWSAVEPWAETAAMLWALLASGQINMRWRKAAVPTVRPFFRI